MAVGAGLFLAAGCTRKPPGILRIRNLLSGSALALLIAQAAVAAAPPTPNAYPGPVSAMDTSYTLGPDVLGWSGNLRALFGTPTSLGQFSMLRTLLAGAPMFPPGVHPMGLMAPDRESLVVVSLEPLESLKNARLASYRVGLWPQSGLAAHDPRYASPLGFIAVTPENASTQVSKHFRLRDFLTHDQQDVWPKVLVLRASLLDKLELIEAELSRRGMHATLHVMSGFRSPQYNALGVGSRGGRASVSRHMYGDAADVFVDEDGDGRMDDLDGDGRITVRDARVLLAVAESVEVMHPDLVGGLSAYPANAEHGPFVHVDTRGKRARW